MISWFVKSLTPTLTSITLLLGSSNGLLLFFDTSGPDVPPSPTKEEKRTPKMKRNIQAGITKILAAPTFRATQKLPRRSKEIQKTTSLEKTIPGTHRPQNMSTSKTRLTHKSLDWRIDCLQRMAHKFTNSKIRKFRNTSIPQIHKRPLRNTIRSPSGSKLEWQMESLSLRTNDLKRF